MRSAAKLLALIGFLAPASLAPALELIYRDPATKKEVKVKNAKIQEGAEGITLLQMGKMIKISPLDVVDLDLDPTDIPAAEYQAYRKPLVKFAQAKLAKDEPSRIKLLRETLPDFETSVPLVTPNTQARRIVEFKQCQTLFFLARVDEKMREKAIPVLSKYTEEQKGTWQIGPSLLMLAQLQEDAGDLTGAQKTHETLGSLPGIPIELQAASLLNAAKSLMKASNFKEAQVKLLDLKGKLAQDSPMAPKVGVFLAQCRILGDNPDDAKKAAEELVGLVGTADDKSLKAQAYNTLGDYNLKQNKKEDAFWLFLRVDTLYSDDKAEHARAIYNLIALFRDFKQDGDRAEQYRDLLLKDPRFAGLDYQKMAMPK